MTAESLPGFYTYLVECADGTLYCGWTVNIEKRLVAHNAGTGAKYTKTRRPVTLKACWSFDTKQEAQRWEYQVKQLTRAQKLQLIKDSLAHTPLAGIDLSEKNVSHEPLL